MATVKGFQIGEQVLKYQDLNLAEEFSSSKAYQIGDYVLYDGQLYRFISNHTAGEWVETDATEARLADDIKAIMEIINNYHTGR